MIGEESFNRLLAWANYAKIRPFSLLKLTVNVIANELRGVERVNILRDRWCQQSAQYVLMKCRWTQLTAHNVYYVKLYKASYDVVGFSYTEQ